MQFIDCKGMASLFRILCVGRTDGRTGMFSYIFHSSPPPPPPSPLFQFPYKRKGRELKNVQPSLKFVENESIPHMLGLDKDHILRNDGSDEDLKNGFLVWALWEAKQLTSNFFFELPSC